MLLYGDKWSVSREEGAHGDIIHVSLWQAPQTRARAQEVAEKLLNDGETVVRRPSRYRAYHIFDVKKDKEAQS